MQIADCESKHMHSYLKIHAPGIFCLLYALVSLFVAYELLSLAAQIAGCCFGRRSAAPAILSVTALADVLSAVLLAFKARKTIQGRAATGRFFLIAGTILLALVLINYFVMIAAILSASGSSG